MNAWAQRGLIVFLALLPATCHAEGQDASIWPWNCDDPLRAPMTVEARLWPCMLARETPRLLVGRKSVWEEDAGGELLPVVSVRLGLSLNGRFPCRLLDWPKATTLVLERSSDGGQFVSAASVSFEDVVAAQSRTGVEFDGSIAILDPEAAAGQWHTYRASFVCDAGRFSPFVRVADTVYLPVPLEVVVRQTESGGFLMQWALPDGWADRVPPDYIVQPIVGPWVFAPEHAARGKLMLPIPTDLPLQGLKAGVYVTMSTERPHAGERRRFWDDAARFFVPAVTTDGSVFHFGEGCNRHVLFAAPRLRRGVWRMQDGALAMGGIRPPVSLPPGRRSPLPNWVVERPGAATEATPMLFWARRMLGLNRCWRLVPGRHEWLEFHCDAPQGKESPSVASARVRFARPPMPMNVEAQAGDGQVRIKWTPFDPLPDAWMSEPEWVVLRADDDSPRHWNRRDLQHDPRPIARLPARTGEFVDKDVVNDRCYAYGLELQGTLRVTTELPGVGTIVQGVPICLEAPRGQWGVGSRCCRYAVPRKARPLRVGLTGEPDFLYRQEAIVLQIRSALLDAPDLLCLERGSMQRLLTERELTWFGETAEYRDEFPFLAGADMHLVLRPPLGIQRRGCEIWLHDFMNSRFERLAALDNQQALGGDVLGEVLAAVRKLAPGLVAAAPTLQTGPTRRAQSVAVVDWHPSGAAAGRAAVTEWLATLLAEGLSNRGMDVVERERVSAAGYEMDRAVWSSRQAVQYGRILAADLLLRGRWEETAGGWYGVWNVVAGRTGEFLGAGCIRAESPEALAAGVAQRTVEVTELPVPGAGTPLWQVIDTLAASMHRSAENVTSRHPLTTPVNPLGEVAIEAEIGALCYRSGQLGRAETHLRRALAGTYCDRVQVCRMLSEIYRSKGRHAEDLHLWRQEYEQAKRDPFDDARRARTTVLRYAEALLANGAHDEAAKVLPEFYSYAPGLASSHRTARLGKLFGEIGMSRARVKTYLSDSSLWYASKSLGELQKSLMMKDGRIRKHILSEFACDTKAPYQALRALEELDSQGSLAPPVLYAGLVAALIVYDYDAADRYARRLLQFSGASILVDDQLHDMLAGLPDNDLDAERQAYLRAVLTCFETVTSRRRAFMPGEAAAAVSLCRSHISRASALLKVPGREPYEKLPSLFKIGNALLWVRGTSVNRTEQSPLWVFAEHRQGACAGFDVAPQGIGRVRWVHYHRGGIRRRYPYNSLPDRRSFTEPATEALMCQGRVITAARSDGVIRALDPETGRTLWKYTAWGPIYDLAVHEDRVFAAILPYALLVLDGDTGNCLAFLPFPEFVGSRRRRLPALKVSDDGGLVALGQAVEVSVELDSFAVRFRPAPAQDAEISWGSMSEEQKIIAIREPAEVPPVDAVWLMQTAGNAAEPLTVRQIAFAALHKCLTRGYEGPVTTFVWEAACDSSWPNSLRESALRDLVWASPTAARDSALVMLEEGNRSLLRTALTVAAQAEPVTWERAVGLARAAMSENSNTRESERDQLEGYIWYNVKRTSNGFPFSPSLGWTEAALEKLASTKLAEKGGIRRNSSLWKALCRNGSRLIPDEWEESHGLVLDRDSGTYSLPEGWREDRFSETDFLEKVAELGDPRVLPAVNAILRDSVQRAPNAGVNSHGTRERAVYEALAAIGAAETVGDILQLISDYGTVPEPASALELLTFLTGRSFPTTYEWCLWYGHTP